MAEITTPSTASSTISSVDNARSPTPMDATTSTASTPAITTTTVIEQTTVVEEPISIPQQPATGKEEKEIIKAAISANSAMKIGDTWYLISSRWWKRWRQYSGYEDSSKFREYTYSSGSFATNNDAFGGTTGGKPGPIDNNDLLEQDRYSTVSEDMALKQSLFENIDYELIPQVPWKILESWYGGGPVVARKAIKTGAYAANPVAIDLRPTGMTCFKSSDLQTRKGFRMSKSCSIGELRKKVAELLGFTATDAFRLWDYHGNSRYKLLDDDNKTLESAQIIDGNPIFLEEKNADGKFPDLPTSNYTYATSSTYGSSSSSYNDHYSGFSSYSASPMEAPGLCGLSNLGNTCFMNSALQCLSNTEPLVMYLLSGKWRRELNTRNPLGTHGELTTEYAALVRNIWKGTSSVFTPRDFKWKLGRFASQFDGYAQHDSQELLAFLLDGMHEDLNRVINKPYIEIPDYNNQPDEQWAEESWQRHLARNNSIIVDLFQGQLRSTVICPRCSHVSITFDPFMYLSLPLPQDHSRSFQATVHFNDPLRLPVRIKVSYNGPNSDKLTIGDFCKSLSEQCPEPHPDPASLVVTDIYGSRFYRRLTEREPIDSMSERDDIHVFEAPIVPNTVRLPVLFSKRERYSSYGSYLTDVLFGTPMVLVLNENATFYDVVIEVFRKLQRFFKHESVNQLIQQYEEEIKNKEKQQQQNQQDTQKTQPLTQQTQMDDVDLVDVEQKPNASGEGQELHRLVSEEYDSESDSDSITSYDSQEERPPLMETNEKEDEEHEQAISQVQKQEEQKVEENKHTPPSRPAPPIPIQRKVEQQQQQPEENKSTASTSASTTTEVVTKTSTSVPEGIQIIEEPEAPIIPGVDNERLLNAIDAFFNVESCDAYGKQPYSRAEELDLGDGNISLKLKPNMCLAIRFTELAAQKYLREKENDFDPASAPPRSGYSGGYQAQPETRASLDECMDLFTQSEQLGPDDLWRCPKCKEFQQATKKFDLWKLPPILVIHLKRFSFKNKYWRDKLDTLVDFPVEGLDLSSRVLLPKQRAGEGQAIYDLYAVSNHYGSLGGGHYTAFAKNKDNGQWHKFDDSHVGTSTADSVKTSAAYMLFYRLRSFQTPTYPIEPDADSTSTLTSNSDSGASTSITPTPAPATRISVSPTRLLEVINSHMHGNDDSDDEGNNNRL